MLIKINGKHTFNVSPFIPHQQFVKRKVPTPMCLKVFIKKKMS